MIFLVSPWSRAGDCVPGVREGLVYKRDSQKKDKIYSFKRESTGPHSARRTYLMGSNPVVVENIQYDNEGRLKLYEISDYQAKIEGKAEVVDNQIRFSYTEKNKTKTGTQEYFHNTVVSDELTKFIYKHWDRIMNGEKIELKLVVVARRETVPFKVYKEKELTVDGKELVLIRMKASNFVVASIIRSVQFTFEKKGKRSLLEYEGRTTPKIKTEDGKWVDHDAVTVYGPDCEKN